MTMGPSANRGQCSGQSRLRRDRLNLGSAKERLLELGMTCSRDHAPSGWRRRNVFPQPAYLRLRHEFMTPGKRIGELSPGRASYGTGTIGSSVPAGLASAVAMACSTADGVSTPACNSVGFSGDKAGDD